MAFWSTEKIRERHSAQWLIKTFDDDRVKHGAYELSLGPEAFITADEFGKKLSQKRKIDKGSQLIIPPGQFGILLTEETISIPLDAIGFISIKASIKFRGLVNVSGFHTDPGFKGRLKFSVYNAGSQDIILERGKPTFLLWLSGLDRITSHGYDGDHYKQNEISTTDVMNIQGEVASPGELNQRLNTAEKTLSSYETMAERLRKVEGDLSLYRIVGGIVAGVMIAAIATAAIYAGSYAATSAYNKFHQNKEINTEEMNTGDLESKRATPKEPYENKQPTGQN